MGKYEDLNLEQLEALNRELEEKQREVRAERVEVTAEIDRKIHLKDAEANLALLSDDQKRALLQVAQAQLAALNVNAGEANSG